MISFLQTGTEVLPSEPIAEKFEWWKIFLCVLAGIAIIGIIVFIAWKVCCKCELFLRWSKFVYMNMSDYHHNVRWPF